MTETGSKGTEQKPKKAKVKLQLKSPSQQRSRQTVATILEACERIMIREGFFGVSTDKVAKEAGVSIGSLYQFFGNKESVVCALIQDLMEKDAAAAKGYFQALAGKPREERIRGLIQVGIDIYSTRSELRSRLQNVYQYLVDTNYFRTLINAYEEQIVALLEPIPGRNMRMVARVYVASYEGLLDAMVGRDPNFQNDKELVSEIYKLYEPFMSAR